MFRIVPLAIIRSFSLYTQQWYMLYSLRAGSVRSVLILLASCQQNCDVYHCCVYSEKLLMTGRGTVRNMESFDILLTVHLSIFISVIKQIDAQKFCFIISLFHATTCFEHMCSSSGGQNCITQPLVSSHLNGRNMSPDITQL